MAKNVIIAILAISVLVLATTIVRLENYHYASVVGMCSQHKADDPLQSVQRHQCLHQVSTRTNPLWHIYYALTEK